MPKNRGRKGNDKKGKGGKKGGKGSDWFTKPLTKKGLKKELRAESKLQFQPEKRQIQSEQRASEMRQQEIPAWFGEYLNTVTRGKQATQMVNAQAQKDMAYRTQNALSQDEALREKLVEEERTSAQQRGTAFDPAFGATLAQASLARRNMGDAGKDLLTQQAASEFAYNTDQERIGRGEAISQVLKEQARSRTLDADLRDLAQRRGAFKVAKRGELRGQEREYGLAQQEFGQESSEARKSRRGQMKLARQYGKNKKREQKRSLSNQITVAEKQGDLKKAEQLRSKRSQLKVGNQQARNKKASQKRSHRLFPPQKAKKKGGNDKKKKGGNRIQRGPGVRSR